MTELYKLLMKSDSQFLATLRRKLGTTSSGGGGGDATWGTITGTLSSQTDLQTALNGKQPVGSYLTSESDPDFDANGVKLTGDQTVAGVKTFSSNVVTPSVKNASGLLELYGNDTYKITIGSSALAGFATIGNVRVINGNGLGITGVGSLSNGPSPTYLEGQPVRIYTKVGANPSIEVLRCESNVMIVGAGSLDTSSIMTVNSTTQGVLFPRQTSAQRTAITTPATGLTVYQTDATEGQYIKMSDSWRKISMDGHTHTQSEITNLTTDLANKASIDNSIDDYITVMTLLGSNIKAQTVGFNPVNANNPTLLNDAVIRYVPLLLKKAVTLTGMGFFQEIVGDFVADNTNGLALFSYSGGTLTKVAETANDGNIWKSTANTLVKVPFTSTYAAQPGLYFAALIYNNSSQTTAPQILHSFNTTNASLNDEAKMFMSQSAQTAFPTSVAMTSLTNQAVVPWLFTY